MAWTDVAMVGLTAVGIAAPRHRLQPLWRRQGPLCAARRARRRRTHGFRPDAESGNNGIEQAWYLKRMPAYGHHNQSSRMILHAAQINAEAWHFHSGRLAHQDLLPDPEPDRQIAG